MTDKPDAIQYAARVLAADLQAHEKDINAATKANDNDALVQAATEQAIAMKENMPFIIYVLKKFSGLNPPVPVRSDAMPTLSQELLGEPDSRVMGSSGVAMAASLNGGKLN